MQHVAKINGEPATLAETVDHILGNSRPFGPDHGVAWASGQGGDYPLWDEPRPVDWEEIKTLVAEMVTDLGTDADWYDWSVSITDVD